MANKQQEEETIETKQKIAQQQYVRWRWMSERTSAFRDRERVCLPVCVKIIEFLKEKLFFSIFSMR